MFLDAAQTNDMGAIHNYGDVKIFSQNNGLETVASVNYGQFWCLHMKLLRGMDSVQPDGTDFRDRPLLFSNRTCV